MIIALLLQRGLHVSDHLVWRQIVVSVDGAIPSIIRVRIIAPCREPVTRVPVIWRAKHEHDAVIMIVPPALVVPLGRVVPENGIPGALPALATLDMFPLLELHSGSLCGIWLFWNIKVLRLYRLALSELWLRRVLARRNLRLVRLACGLYVASIGWFGCLPLIRRINGLSLNLGLVFLALLNLISSVGSLRPLPCLSLIRWRRGLALPLRIYLLRLIR